LRKTQVVGIGGLGGRRARAEGRNFAVVQSRQSLDPSPQALRNRLPLRIAASRDKSLDYFRSTAIVLLPSLTATL